MTRIREEEEESNGKIFKHLHLRAVLTTLKSIDYNVAMTFILNNNNNNNSLYSLYSNVHQETC